MTKIPNSKITEVLPGVKKNILLAGYTTFRIGGPAQYFFIAKNKNDLIKAIKMAKRFKLPFFILGGGSNVLVSDEGFKGLVIKIQDSRLKIKNSKIYAGAGGELNDLVKFSAKESLAGLEWAAGIPGTVGGAIYGNAAAFGEFMAGAIKSIEVLDFKTEKIKIFSQKDYKSNYKKTIFKKNKNLIILSAEFQLKKGNKKEIQKNIKQNINYRKKNHPLNFPSAGSIFKNPPGKIAGILIEKCGLKGKRIGQAQISKKHANFIVNLGGAKAKEVIKLINLVKEKVKNKFGKVLEEEIQYFGFSTLDS